MARKCKWTDQELIEAVKNSCSISGVTRVLGTTSRSSVEKRIEEMKLDISHFSRKKMSGLNKYGEPNAAWKKFKDKLDNYSVIPVEQWKEEQILGHIIKKYKDFYKCEYSLSYNKAPSKSTEMYCIRRMIASVGNDDPIVIKKYIDFIFDDIIIPKNITVKSLSFFFTYSFIFEFKSKLRKMDKISRSTPLPDQYLTICNDLQLPIHTYGDLAFAKLASESDQEEYTLLFDQLQKLGFDSSKLDRLEN